MFYKFTSTILILLTKMKKITLLDFNQNQSVKPKRWYSLLAFSFIMLTCQIGLAQFTFPTISGPITITGGTDVVQNINNTANSAGVTAEDYEGFIVTVDWTNVDNAYSSEARLIVTTSSGATEVLFPTSGSAANTDPATITFEADFNGIYSPATNGSLDFTLRQSWTASQANWSNIVITLVPVPACLEPTTLTATNITMNSATLGWTSEGNSFDIEWGPTGFEQGGDDSTLVSDLTSNSYDATFTEGGAYQFYVRQNCGDTDGFSLWAGPFSFAIPQIGDDCSAPIVVTTLPYTTTDDTANYTDNTNIEGTPGASGCGSTNNYLNGNDVVYSFTADFDGNILVSLDPTNTYAGIFAYASCEDIGENCIGGAVAGFTSDEVSFQLSVENGSTYYFVISTWATPQTTPYTLEITQLLCLVPSSLTATNITNDSAQLAWTADGDLFDVEFGETGFTPTGNPTNANTTGVENPFTLEGLTENTAYQYYVRQDCGDINGTSEWVGPFSFKTECNVLIAPTTVQDFTGYTAAAPATLDCWKEAIGNFANGTTGSISAWEGQNYNNDSTHPNGNAAYINLYGSAFGGPKNDWLISPAIDLGDGTTPYQLKFDVSVTPWTGSANVTEMGEKFVKLIVSTDGGATWLESNVIKTYDNSDVPNSGGRTDVFSLDGYTGVVKFAYYAFATETTPDLRFFIDNWSIQTNPCADFAAPTGNAFQTLSEGQTLADLVVAGENLTWYSDDNLENQIPSTTVAEDNTTYFVTQTVDECTSEALAVTVEVTLSTGDFNLVSLKAHPNPTSDFVTVSYNNDITNVAVINMLGQTLMTKNVNANTTQIDMTSLPTGNYFVKVTVEGAVKTIKIVKN